MSFLLPGSRATVQSAATTGNGSAYSLHPKANSVTVTATGEGTISGGTVYVEEAATEDYDGTWSELDSFPGTELTGGAQKVLHFSGVFGAIRVRLDSIAGGGSVSADIAAG